MSNFVINPYIVVPPTPEIAISCEMTAAPAGSNITSFGFSDDPSATVKGQYGINIYSGTEVEITQNNQTDETSIDPSTLASAPFTYKIVLTESGGAIASCTYTVNGVTMSPSFSFSAVGSTGKTGQLYFNEATVSGTKIQLHTTDKKWVTVDSSSPTISTTTNTDDTATRGTSSCTGWCHYVTMGNA